MHIMLESLENRTNIFYYTSYFMKLSKIGIYGSQLYTGWPTRIMDIEFI